MKAIEEKLSHILVDEFQVSSALISPKADFDLDLDLDSLDYMEYVMRIEQTFSIQIPDKVAVHIKTVEQMALLVEYRIAEKDKYAALIPQALLIRQGSLPKT